MKNRILVSLFVLLALSLVSGAHFQAFGGQSQEVITVKGSESMAPVIESLAKEYMRSQPDCIVKVSVDGDTGWKAFLSRESDVAIASRRIRDEEKKAAVGAGLGMQETVIEWGAIAIVVHPTNPFNELTAEQVRNIFVGRTANWSEIGGPDRTVSILNVPQAELATADYFERYFLEWPISPTAEAKDSFASVVETVALDPGAVGYVRLGKLEHLRQRVGEARIKVLSIMRDEKASGVYPSKDTVASGVYPLMRPYYMYIDGNAPKSYLKAFVGFCAAN